MSGGATAAAGRLPVAGRRRWWDGAGVYMVWHRDLVRFARQRSRLLSGIARSLVWLFALGLGLRSSFVPIGGLTYEQFLFPGIIGMAVIFSSLQSAISIIWDREFGYLREVLVAPIPRGTIVYGKVLGGASTASVQAAVVFLLIPVVGLSPSPSQLLAALAMTFVTALAMTSLGVLIAARMRDFEGFGTIQNFVVMPLYLLSGAVFPVAKTTGTLHLLVSLDPLSYGVDALRQLLTGYAVHPLGVDVAVLLGLTAILVAASVFLFEREG
jgi:ABC-2 type transport system permease protein